MMSDNTAQKELLIHLIQQAVGGCAVVIGGRETLIVHAAGPTRCKDHALCPDNDELKRLHIEENRACGIALVVLNNLDGGGELQDRDLSVQDFVAQGSHDFGTGIVLAGVHPLP